MSLAPATRLGPYEIIGALGAGGMGEVYRARDTRLGREVALKILPPEVTGDPSRRQRFELEARAVAALSHPNIVAIYDVGEEAGVFYIVSELVEGEPLHAGRFGLRKVLELGAQIAGGLAAAHDVGIVHRDLKPANILVTRDGRAKILDFGLAKMTVRVTSESAATLTVNTEPGVVLGTAAFMSPEQVRGIPADHRADIFSLGAILYELLGGARAFRGNTSVEIMTAVLRHDPPELPDSVPAAVRLLVAHCLEKEPANRFQSARDLAFALQSPPSPVPSIRAPRVRRRLLPAIAALVLVAFGFGVHALVTRAPEPFKWSGVRLGGPEIALESAVSPDGQLLAFVAIVDGLTQVGVMKPESGNWSILTHRRDQGLAGRVTWSQDSSLIYFDRIADVPRGIFSVPVLGGDERLVLENAAIPSSLADGTLLLYRMNSQQQVQLFRFWQETGRLQDFPITTPNAFDLFARAAVLPDARRAIVGGRLGNQGSQERFVEVDTVAGTVRPLAASGYDGSNVRSWTLARDGRSILAAIAADTLQRIVSIPIDGWNGPQSLFTVTGDVWSIDSGPHGSVYAALVERPAELVKLSLTGARPETIASFAQVPEGGMVLALPDGRTVIPEHVMGRDRLMAVERGKSPVPLLNTPEETSAPMSGVGPRGIAFVIGSNRRQTIAVADTGTGRIARRLAPAKGVISSIAASPDGATLYFAADGSVWSIPTAGGDPQKITAGDAVIADPSGPGLVIVRNESSRVRLFQVAPGGGAEKEIPVDGTTPILSAYIPPGPIIKDGRMLVHLALPDSWFNPPAILDITTGRLKRLANNPLNDYGPTWTPDGGAIALQVGLRSTLWRFRPEVARR